MSDERSQKDTVVYVDERKHSFSSDDYDVKVKHPKQTAKGFSEIKGKLWSIRSRRDIAVCEVSEGLDEYGDPKTNCKNISGNIKN